MTVFATLEDPGLSETFLRLLADGDEYGAVGVVTGLLDGGVPPQRVLIDLISDALTRVGDRWVAAEWSVADEHAASAICELAVAAVAARTPVRAHRGRIVVTCVDDEWHALPVRILAEMLRLDGWRTDFLGACMPRRHLIARLRETKPDVVAISCTLPTRLPGAHATITACRLAGFPVIAGGRGFGPDDVVARRLGADAWAADAVRAVTTLRANCPQPIDQPHASAGYLGSPEYTLVVRLRDDLIAEALRRLAVAYPPMGTYDQHQAEATAEDMETIVDFLTAALYVGDERVFTGFVDWAARVLEARGVPRQALTIGLQLYRDQLGDFPMSLAVMDSGLARLGR